MATVKLVLRKSKSRSDGTAPVYLRVTANRKSRFLASGIYLSPRHWNADRQQVRRSHDLSDAYNARLHDLRLEAERLSLSTDTATEIKAQLTGTGGTFSSYLGSYIGEMDAQKRFWSWKRYRVVRGKVQDCLGDKLDWTDLDRSALLQLERYMREKLQNGPNTIRKEMGLLRSMYTQAVKDGAVSADLNPFLRYDAPKVKQPKRRKLSLEEIQMLAATELEPGTWAQKARDAWLISFYLGGMRFGDLATLKAEDVQNGRCTYRMNKTDKLVSVPIPEPARLLLAPYLDGKAPDDFAMPFLKAGDDADPRYMRKRISSNNVLCNKGVKVAAERAGLDEPDNLSMHISRHSFADYARTKSGDLYAISKTLGHSSLTITQQYLKSFDQDAVDRLADDLWK